MVSARTALRWSIAFIIAMYAVLIGSAVGIIPT